jgi:hypothetical protein
MRFFKLTGQGLRTWAAAMLAFAVGVGGVASIASMLPAVSEAQQSVLGLDAEGLAANQAWWGALVSGTPDAVGAVLAPEFQIMRADGSAYDKDDYLASQLPKVAAIPEFSQMAVTAHDDLLVTRYYVTVKETRDGATVEAHAPRLTVFRKEDGKWLVVAHANFATLER